ncbi:MAG: hypothetical protein AB8F95_11995, partial [Bacteroidia bacterium]
MRLFTLFLLTIAAFSSLQAQQNFDIKTDTLRYRLTTAQARDMLRSGKWEKGSKWDKDAPIGTFVDTIHADNVSSRAVLPFGYYHDVYADGVQLKHHVFVVSNIQYSGYPFQGKPWLTVPEASVAKTQVLEDGKTPLAYDTAGKEKKKKKKAGRTTLLFVQ